MPHLTVEYSENLPPDDLQRLCALLHGVLLADGAFEVGAVRVRAICCRLFAIADLHPENAFVAIILRVGAGRDDHIRKRIGNAIFAACQTVFAKKLDQPYFALSLDIIENDPSVSWKANTMHARLRKTRTVP